MLAQIPFRIPKAHPGPAWELEAEPVSSPFACQTERGDGQDQHGGDQHDPQQDLLLQAVAVQILG